MHQPTEDLLASDQFYKQHIQNKHWPGTGKAPIFLRCSMHIEDIWHKTTSYNCLRKFFKLYYEHFPIMFDC